MYKRAVHYLQGSEWVEIQCACPERVLNLLGARGIVFWDLTWESEICLRLRMLLRQEALLREIAEQTGAEITVMSRRGVPLLWALSRRTARRSTAARTSPVSALSLQAMPRLAS